MNKDYTQKTQQLAEQRQRVQQFEQTLQNYAPVFGAMGYTPDQALQEFFGFATQLARNPSEALKGLAQRANVDLSSLMEEQPYVDDGVRQVQQQMQEQWQNWQQQQAQQQHQQTMQAAQAQIAQQIQDFAQAKGEDGDPLYPHFEKVQDQMAGFITGGLASGLPQAYEMAVRNSDDLQKQIKAEQERKEAAKRNAKAKKSATAAKSVKGKGTKGKPPERSLEEELSAAYDEQTA